MKNKKMTAFVYSGQGSQFTGMGRDIFESFETARAVYDSLGENFREISFGTDIEELSKTENLQPIMVTMQLAITRVLRENGIYPDMACGVSLGEYSAFAAAGALTFNDAIALVEKRGTYMAEAVKGIDSDMIAIIGSDEASIKQALEKTNTDESACYISNINSSKQIVISGEKTAVERAKNELSARTIPLKVSGPFHTPYVNSGAEKLRHHLREICWTDTKIPVYTNFTGQKLDIGYEENFVNQMISAVRLFDCLKNMVADGAERVIEIGSGNVVSGIMKKEFPEVECICIRDAETLKNFIDSERGNLE